MTATTQLNIRYQNQFHPPDQSWAGFFKGTKIKVVDQRGEWLGVCGTDENNYCWLKKDNLVSADHVAKAAVIKDKTPLFDAPHAETPLKDGEGSLGALFFILKRDKDFCQVNTGGSMTAWISCSALSTEKPYVKAAETLEQVRFLKEGREYESALNRIAAAKKDPQAHFLPLLTKEEPALNERLQALKAAQAQPDYQNCFLGYNFREGEKE